ncbi:Mov34/MPN/PAD-1 family protein [Alicyclobacillus hesperidum]|uniref:Proteasome lid subunit RPN8/RPN11, contains Jab1/MPN metalloenzyme (JAMM) motif n=1 Tax=Alicyclobacillus hesperidum TaxID=89784 RepID=A0A1H2T6X9_9BACL|nr:Mov34/MPN/PAD-1 family protein [Alicyclobacillus hesperidum]SDW39641.1 Proteasome lid subunit RPN8/RPN11, contains Jab1/MPN metalloenzyme (JAMM) motif [Alicyclobacillus hesperidum]
MTLWTETSHSLPKEILCELTSIAVASHPYECVGLVVWRRRYWTVPLPAIASPRSVLVDPAVLIPTLYLLDHHSVCIVASFHSHPNGLERPSKLDDGFRLYGGSHILLVREHESFTPRTFIWSS